MVVLSVRKAVVVHLAAGFLSGVWRPVDRKVSGKMDGEKVGKLSLCYCRFCGAYAERGQLLKHRGRCRRNMLGVIDHVPDLHWWCPSCGRAWEKKPAGGSCLYCQAVKLVKRYL